MALCRSSVAEVFALHRIDDERPLAARVRHAARWRERLVGLLGQRDLSSGEGLWITPCNSIHTFGMRFDIDVLFLDRDLRIVRTLTTVKPWRMAVARARSVVELAAGSIDRHQLRIGERLRLTPTLRQVKQPSTGEERLA